MDLFFRAQALHNRHKRRQNLAIAAGHGWDADDDAADAELRKIFRGWQRMQRQRREGSPSEPPQLALPTASTRLLVLESPTAAELSPSQICVITDESRTRSLNALLAFSPRPAPPSPELPASSAHPGLPDPLSPQLPQAHLPVSPVSTTTEGTRRTSESERLDASPVPSQTPASLMSVHSGASPNHRPLSIRTSRRVESLPDPALPVGPVACHANL